MTETLDRQAVWRCFAALMAKPRLNDIPIAYLRECLVLDLVTGELTWRTRPREHFATKRSCSTWNARYAGKRSGSLLPIGYWLIALTFAGRQRGLLSHRVIFALATGAWPVDEVDHKNGRRSENRLNNLREATRVENCQNQPVNPRNTSGFPGVSRVKRSGKWMAKVNTGGRCVYRREFDTPQKASAAYLAAKAEFHPFAPTLRQLV